MGATELFTFAWWNLHDFAHFDPDKIGRSRWPSFKGDYEAKRGRIYDVFSGLCASGLPDLIGVCEITGVASRDLLSLFPPAFEVAIAPEPIGSDGFGVAIFYRKDRNISAELPLIPSDTDGRTPRIPGRCSRYI